MEVLAGGGVPTPYGVFLIHILSTLQLVSADEKCVKTYKLDRKNDKKKIRIALPQKAPTCHYNILGDKDCDVELSCKIDMPKVNDACDDVYVKVTDGAWGYKTYCGQASFDKLRPNKGLRDLFMVLETSGEAGGSATHDGLTCTANCIDKFSDEEGDRLKKNLDLPMNPSCVCGLQSHKDDRIVGGEDAKEFEIPWQAAIVFPETRAPIAGGVIINDRYILTSAHTFCFGRKKNLTADDIEVVVHAHLLDMTKKKGYDKNAELGEKGSIKGSGWDLDKKTDEDERTQRFKVLEIVKHPLFTMTFDYDYALLKLDRKIDFEAEVSPVCLPPADTFDSVSEKWNENTMLTLSGWGMSDELAAATTRMLQKIELPFYKYERCRKYNEEVITRRFLCTGFADGKGGKDACAGDSGGPVTKMMANKQWWVFGIVSWGEGCGRDNRPGFSARVTEQNQWIYHQGSFGGAKWCKFEL